MTSPVTLKHPSEKEAAQSYGSGSEESDEMKSLFRTCTIQTINKQTKKRIVHNHIVIMFIVITEHVRKGVGRR